MWIEFPIGVLFTLKSELLLHPWLRVVVYSTILLNSLFKLHTVLLLLSLWLDVEDTATVYSADVRFPAFVNILEYCQFGKNYVLNVLDSLMIGRVLSVLWLPLK